MWSIASDHARQVLYDNRYKLSPPWEAARIDAVQLQGYHMAKPREIAVAPNPYSEKCGSKGPVNEA